MDVHRGSDIASLTGVVRHNWAGSMTETRKLAAILVADVVGFSRLAEADEERLRRLSEGLRAFPLNRKERLRVELTLSGLDPEQLPPRPAALAEASIHGVRIRTQMSGGANHPRRRLRGRRLRGRGAGVANCLKTDLRARLRERPLPPPDRE
jgi:hypothetical protein